MAALHETCGLCACNAKRLHLGPPVCSRLEPGHGSVVPERSFEPRLHRSLNSPEALMRLDPRSLISLLLRLCTALFLPMNEGKHLGVARSPSRLGSSVIVRRKDLRCGTFVSTHQAIHQKPPAHLCSPKKAAMQLYRRAL